MRFPWQPRASVRKAGERPGTPYRRRTQPQIELLEDRCLLSSGKGAFLDPLPPIPAGWGELINRPEVVHILGIDGDTGLAGDGLTSDTTPAVLGTGTPGASFWLSVNGSQAATGTVGADGTWRLQLGELEEGSHLITAGTVEGMAVTAYPIWIDTTAPQVTLQAPTHTVNPFVLATLTLAPEDGRGAPPFVAIDYDLNRDGDFDDEGEADWMVTTWWGGETNVWLALPPGNHTLRARAVDLAGNVGVSDPVEIRVAIPSYSAYPPGGYPAAPAPYLNNVDPAQPLPPEPKAVPAVDAGQTYPWLRVLDASGDDPAPPTRVQLLDSQATESEPNNSIATANIVNAVANERLTISGSIGSATDLDYFEFTLSTRAGVFFDIDSREIGLSTTLDTVLTLYNASGVVLDSNDNGYDFDTGYPAPASEADSASADSALYRDLAAGTYYIRVSAVGGTTGDYQLHIRPDTNYSNSVPQLSSNPGAAATLFLDFDGHSDNDAWGAYNVAAFDFNGDTSEFTPAEQLAIRNIWRMVSEDFSPFDINVTTVYTGSFTDGVAFRHVITSNDGSAVSASGALGIAFLNSFASGGSTDQVAFTFAPNFEQQFGGGISGQIMATPVEQGNTTSHEFGHALGLIHYGGTNGSLSYLLWTPDEGLNRETWGSGLTHSGESPITTQDDMAIIAGTSNGFGYRTDDHGNTAATATVLTVSGLTYSASGIIAHISNDLDFFKFTTAAGQVTIRVDVDDYVSNLDVELRVYDAAGNLVGAHDPIDSFDAILVLTLSEGEYFVEVRSDGDPGEAGQYTVTIVVPGLPQPPPPPPEPPPTPTPTPIPTPTPGGGGDGGGTTTPVTTAADPYESNDTAEAATNFGTLTSEFNAANLSINLHASGLWDQDWFQWTAGYSGTLNVALTNINANGGDLHVRVFIIDNGAMTEVGNSTLLGSASQGVSVGITAGQTFLVWIYGYNFSTGLYNLTVNIT